MLHFQLPMDCSRRGVALRLQVVEGGRLGSRDRESSLSPPHPTPPHTHSALLVMLSTTRLCIQGGDTQGSLLTGTAF